MRNQAISRNKNSENGKLVFGTSGGFTLVEILTTTVLAFLLFSLIYATFFSISTVTATLQEKMSYSETIFGFLNSFNEEIKCMICEEGDNSPVFTRETLQFTTKTGAVSYPVRITYTVDTAQSGKQTLVRKQENLLTGYSFAFPAIKNADGINFVFYNGEYWNQSVESARLAATAIEMDIDGEKIFFPVMIYRDKDDEEKKK